MSDNGHYETITSRLRQFRERSDEHALKQGILACHLDTVYGMGTIPRAADDAGISRSSLYEYRAVWAFYFQPERRLSAWRILKTHDDLTYTHLRTALELEDIDAALEAFEAVTKGDVDYPELSENLPMTTGAFMLYVAAKLGKPISGRPLAEGEGPAYQVAAQIGKLGDQRVKYKIWKVAGQ